MIDRVSRKEQATALAEEVAAELNADILLINGGIDTTIDRDMIRLVIGRQTRRQDVFLILTTEGGSADAAFRMARCLQSCYRRFTVVIPGWCKSAGTLICIGAHTLLIGDLGELGPLDVQLAKPDELGLISSGLTIDSSFRSLQTVAFGMFETFMLEVIKKSGGVITTKTAAELSASLTTGLLSPIFGQMDPMKIGEDYRSTRIAEDYAARLDAHAHNLESDEEVNAIELLVRGYPSHGFVIDRTEAAELFHNVGPIEGRLKDLIDLIGPNVIHARSTQPILAYLNTEASDVSAKPTTPPAGARRPGNGKKPEPKDGSSSNEISPNPPEGTGNIAVPEPNAVEINKRHN